MLSVFDICTGGVGYDPTNLARVGDVLAQKPELAFYGSQRGPATCEITGLPKDGPPAPSALPTGGASSVNELPSAGESLVVGSKGPMIGLAAVVMFVTSALLV